MASVTGQFDTLTEVQLLLKVREGKISIVHTLI